MSCFKRENCRAEIRPKRSESRGVIVQQASYDNLVRFWEKKNLLCLPTKISSVEEIQQTLRKRSPITAPNPNTGSDEEQSPTFRELKSIPSSPSQYHDNPCQFSDVRSNCSALDKKSGSIQENVKMLLKNRELLATARQRPSTILMRNDRPAAFTDPATASKPSLQRTVSSPEPTKANCRTSGPALVARTNPQKRSRTTIPASKTEQRVVAAAAAAAPAKTADHNDQLNTPKKTAVPAYTREQNTQTRFTSEAGSATVSRQSPRSERPVRKLARKTEIRPKLRTQSNLVEASVRQMVLNLGWGVAFLFIVLLHFLLFVNKTSISRKEKRR